MADKPLVWLVGTLSSPPYSPEARRQAGFLLRLLQRGERLSMPDSRPMRDIGKRCHELRIKGSKGKATWRILHRIDEDAIVIVHWFDKDTNKTPKRVIDTCKQRLSRYDRTTQKRS